MNVKNIFLAAFATIVGLTGVSLAQIPGAPFAFAGLDFYGFFLPWIFTFAIVYGLLLKLDLFGGDSKKISGALAFVMAFFVTGVGGPQLALFFTSLFGGASMFLAGILVIILFATLVGVKAERYSNLGALAIVIIAGIVLFLGSSGQFIAISFIGPDIASAIFWLVIIIVAIYFVMHETAPKGGTKKAGE
jgi:hypothetical protein